MNPEAKGTSTGQDCAKAPASKSPRTPPRPGGSRHKCLPFRSQAHPPGCKLSGLSCFGANCSLRLLQSVFQLFTAFIWIICFVLIEDFFSSIFKFSTTACRWPFQLEVRYPAQMPLLEHLPEAQGLLAGLWVCHRGLVSVLLLTWCLHGGKEGWWFSIFPPSDITLS